MNVSVYVCVRVCACVCTLAQPVSLERLQHYGSETTEAYLRLAQQVLFLGIYPKKIIRGVLSAQLRAVQCPEARKAGTWLNLKSARPSTSWHSLGSVMIVDVVIEFSNVAAASRYDCTVEGGAD